MPITLPDVSPKHELAHKLFEVAISNIPLVGGPLAALYSVTSPSKGEVDEKQWRREVTDTLNSKEQAIEFVKDSITLSDDAASLGKWLSQKSETGRSAPFDYQTIAKAFPEATPTELLDAASELAIEGFVDVKYAINASPFSHLRVNFRLYEAFDPIVFEDANPRADAVVVAEELLQSKKQVSALNLCEKYKWTVRRVNPAMSIAGQFVADDHKSHEINRQYAITCMYAHGEDRIELKRFIQRVNGS